MSVEYENHIRIILVITSVIPHCSRKGQLQLWYNDANTMAIPTAGELTESPKGHTEDGRWVDDVQ